MNQHVSVSDHHLVVAKTSFVTLAATALIVMFSLQSFTPRTCTGE